MTDNVTADAAEAGFETILYETPAPRVARIVVNKPEKRNAQSYRMLYELNQAFDIAAQDPDISAIIVAAAGPDFSSGHDLRDEDRMKAFEDFPTVGTWAGFKGGGVEGRWVIEKEMYLGLSERWRNIPKPTIAQVQGRCFAGGMQLIWPCDLIIAADDASFRINAMELGVACAEFFHEPWELGTRKAKEILFTGDVFSAVEAHRLGMVNQVVPAADLESYTLSMAARIAEKQLFALRLAKEVVNAAEDRQGRKDTLLLGFAYHHLSHAYNQERFGMAADPTILKKYGKRPG